MMSDYSKTPTLTHLRSRKFLRRLELEAYASVVSAFRAQGHLSREKRTSLDHLSKCLGISPERHRAEIRRAVNDDTLGQVADCVCGVDTERAWRCEGQKLLSGLPPRLVSHPHPPLLPQALTAITAATHTLGPHASSNTSNTGAGSELSRRVPTPIQNALRVILSNGPNSNRSDQTPTSTAAASSPKVSSSQVSVQKSEGGAGVSVKEELSEGVTQCESVKPAAPDQGKIYSQLESLLCVEQLNSPHTNAGNEGSGYRVNSSTQTSSMDISQKDSCPSPQSSRRGLSSQDRDVTQTGSEDVGNETSSDKVDSLQQEETMETENKEGSDSGKTVREGISDAGKTISDLISRISRKRQRSPNLVAEHQPPTKKKSVLGTLSDIGPATAKARVTVSPLVARAATATATKPTATSATSTSSKSSSQLSVKVTPTSRALSILKAVANSPSSNKALTTAAAKLVSRSSSQGKSQTTSSSGVQVIPISSHTDPALNQAIETLNKALSSLSKAGISSFSAVAPSVKASAAAALKSRSLSPSRRMQPATQPSTAHTSTSTTTSRPISHSTVAGTTAAVAAATTVLPASSTLTCTATSSSSVASGKMPTDSANNAAGADVAPVKSNIITTSTASAGVATTSMYSTASDKSSSDTLIAGNPSQPQDKASQLQPPQQSLLPLSESGSPSKRQGQVLAPSRPEISAELHKALPPHSQFLSGTQKELPMAEGHLRDIDQTKLLQQVTTEEQLQSPIDPTQQIIASEVLQGKLPTALASALLKDASLPPSPESNFSRIDHTESNQKQPGSPRTIPDKHGRPKQNLPKMTVEPTSAEMSGVTSLVPKQDHLTAITASDEVSSPTHHTIPSHPVVPSANYQPPVKSEAQVSNSQIPPAINSSQRSALQDQQATSQFKQPVLTPASSALTKQLSTPPSQTLDLPITSVLVHSGRPVTSVPVQSGVPVSSVPVQSGVPVSSVPVQSGVPVSSVPVQAGVPTTHVPVLASMPPVVTVSPHPFVEPATLKPHPHILAEALPVQPHPPTKSSTVMPHPLSESSTVRPHPLTELSASRPTLPLRPSPAVQSSSSPCPPIVPDHGQEEPHPPSVRSPLAHVAEPEPQERELPIDTDEIKRGGVVEGTGSLSVGAEVPPSSLNISELIEDTSDSAVSSLATQLAGLENAIPLLNMDLMSFLQPATPDSPVPSGGLPIFPLTPELPVSSAPNPPSTPLHPAAQALLSPIESPSMALSPAKPSLVEGGTPLPSSESSQPVLEISTLATSKDVSDCSVTGDHGNPTSGSSPTEYLNLDINSLIDPSKLLEGIPEDMAKSIQTIVQLDEETWK